jgi:HemX protein
MNLNDVRDLLWLATACYGASFVLGMVKTRHSFSPFFRESPFVLILAGFFLQTRALYFRGLEVHGCPLGNGLERAQFIIWSLIVAFLLLRLVWRINLLGTFCAGASLLLGALSLGLRNWDAPYWMATGYLRLFKDPWIELHASIAIFSYGLFCLLAVVSLMYLSQRQALLSRKPGFLGPYLPPIQDLEVAAMRLLAVGVAFLTLSMVVGAMHWTRHPEFVSGAKLTVSTALWVGYLFLLGMRLSNRLYGSRFAKWAIGLFTLALLSLSIVSTGAKKQAFHNPSLPPLAHHIQ